MMLEREFHRVLHCDIRERKERNCYNILIDDLPSKTDLAVFLHLNYWANVSFVPLVELDRMLVL